MKKFEPKYRLKRSGLGGDKTGPGRRAKKDTKNRMKMLGSIELRRFEWTCRCFSPKFSMVFRNKKSLTI